MSYEKISKSKLRLMHGLGRGIMTAFSVPTHNVNKTARDSCVHISVFHLLLAPVPLPLVLR